MGGKERERGSEKRETGRELIRSRKFWLCTNKAFIVFPSSAAGRVEAKTYRIHEREGGRGNLSLN